jgi:uncharacterized protein (DUF885 family)
MRRRLLLVGVVVAGALLAAAALFVIPTLWLKPWSIEHFYARVFLEYALERPMLLSQLRILEPWGLDFHSDDLDDFSVEFTLETAEQVRRNLALLRSYDRESQSAEQRLSTEVLEWFLDAQARREPFLFHDYPLNQLDGVQSELPEFMIHTHQVNDLGGARDYVARLSKFGAALDQAVASMRYRAERGVVPPRFVLERVQRESESFVTATPREHALYAHLVKRLESLERISEPARERVLGSALRAMEESVYPAYRRVAREVSELERAASDDAGVWKLPDGGAFYAWALRWHTTTERTAEEIHAVGLREVDRIHAEMRRILAAEGYDTTDLGAALSALGREGRFLYPDTAEGRKKVLEDYQAIVEEAAAQLPRLFGRLPLAPVRVERVPEFREEGAPGAYYQPPALDGSRPGIFYANLRNVLENPRFRMRTLAFHEAIPGHHLQIAIAQELQGVPFFRRVIPFTAFTEGWALYAERLAAEEGLHPTPFDRLGQLVDEVFRAARLVVDTGIHARRWTREQAIDYMLRATGMPETEVVAEVERYIVIPGQACAYKMGQLEILRLRDRARAALGDRFDLREFHDVVLGAGALPMVILERIVEEWIEAKGGAAAAGTTLGSLRRTRSRG